MAVTHESGILQPRYESWFLTDRHLSVMHVSLGKGKFLFLLGHLSTYYFLLMIFNHHAISIVDQCDVLWNVLMIKAPELHIMTARELTKFKGKTLKIHCGLVR